MKITVEIVARWFPIVILSILTGIAGCSGDADDSATISGNPPGGIVKDAAKTPGGATTGEGDVRAVQTGVSKKGERGAMVDETEPDPASLVYSREYYSYNVRKKKDPFQPLLTKGGQLDGLTLNELTLTGIMWGEERSLAVMEDSQGRGYLLQVGDKVAGARLVAIREDAAVFRVVEFGVVHNIEKKLFIQEEKPI